MAETAHRDDWKSKYRELLSEYEHKEGVWQEADGVLRGTATRLAIAAMGRDAMMDKHLAVIVDVIKGRQPESLLELELDGLSNAVLDHEQALGASLDLSEFVASLDIDAADQKRVIDALEADGGNNRTHALIELASDLNSLLAVRSDAEQADEPHKTIQHVLATLVRHMHTVPGLGAAVDELKGRLAGDLSSKTLDTLLQNLASAVTSVIRSIDEDKQQLEAFLEQVTQQLAQFELWAQGSENEAIARRQEADQLERGVEEEVGSLKGDLESSSEMSDLKLRVQQRLDAIAQQFKAFRQSEDQRTTEASKRHLVLLEEINQLRVRTHELAERCKSQEEQLMHDTLTGVYTRYAYEKRLQEEYQRWQRHGQSLCYSIWDIDHFKHVNDNFGHQTGDKLLSIVATMLSTSTRAEDFVARIGGEEFVVLFPATNLEMASELTDRLRKKIAGVKFHFKGAPILVTISCGITDFRQGDTPQSVYERADKALYSAKTGGRNRVVRS